MSKYIFKSISILFISSILLISSACLIFADEYITYSFTNNTCTIEGQVYKTLYTESQCEYGARSISNRANDSTFWQNWLREFSDASQKGMSAIAKDIFTVVTTGKADKNFYNFYKNALKNDADRNYAELQTYLTNLLNNGSNKNYYTNSDKSKYNNYSVIKTQSVYNATTNNYNETINKLNYTYNNNTYNYDIDNYTYNTYTNNYTFHTVNNNNITYINNYNNTTIVDNSNIYNLYYRLPDGSDSFNMTEEEALNGYKTSLSVASYSNTYDSDNLQFLYHLDGNNYNSAYPKEVNLTLNPNSVEYINSANFNQALILSENVDINIDKSNLYYSFRLNPRINDKFELYINDTLIAKRTSKLNTTYGYVEWEQNTTYKNDVFNYTFTTDSSYVTCPNIDGYEHKSTNVGGTSPNRQVSCLYQSTSNSSTTNQRTYNIINNKLYVDEGTRYLNYNQYNFISISLNGEVYINGINTNIVINNNKFLHIKIIQDGLTYIDELSGFNVNRSFESPSLPYDTNLTYILPSVEYEKVPGASIIKFIPESNGEYGHLLSNEQIKYLTDNDIYLDTTKYSLYYKYADGTVNAYAYLNNNYYLDYLILNRDGTFTINTNNIDNGWGKSVFEGEFKNYPDQFRYITCLNLNINGSQFGLPKTSYYYDYSYDYVLKTNDSIVNNQLLIKSNLYVKDYKFGGIRPSNPIKSYVYVNINEQGYIKSIQQFNGIEWVEVKASIYNANLNKWINALDFNVFLNDWSFVDNKYSTDNSLFNTLFMFLTDKFNDLIDSIKSISFINNNEFINNITNDYNINYENGTKNLINDLNNTNNNINFSESIYNINTQDKNNIQSLEGSVNSIVSGLNNSGIGFMVLVPIIIGLVGLIL